MKKYDNETLRRNPPVFVNERELVIITGLCARTITNYVKAGLIPRIKINRRVLFRWKDVDAALAKLSSIGSAPS
jgi:hypothetical protein